jgi:rSAM/selenodomain-associated transferase 2
VMPESRSIAVIVPVLNEAQGIAPLLDDLAAHGFDEVLIADGGSRDDTPTLAASRPDVTVLTGARGRGAQMNLAAASASSDILLFLHADTRLPPGAALQIRCALDRPAAVGGCFRLRFDRSSPTLRISEWFSRFDSGWTSFGDHGFFVLRSAFEAAGGYPDWPLLEDVELRRRLLRLGRFVKAQAPVVTSARRFHAEGVLRRQMRNGLILGLHALGVSAATLKRFYS